MRSPSRLALALFLSWSSPALAEWPVLAEGGRQTDRVVEPTDLVDVVWDGAPVVSDASDLATVAGSIADARERRAAFGNPPPHGMLDELDVGPEDIQRTLRFVQQIAEEDRDADVQRLSDPAWIAAHFRVLKMHPDAEEAAAHRVRLSDDRLRLTRYLVYRFPGSLEKTDRHDTALYRVPDDEGPAATASVGSTLLRMALSRKDVLDGAFESEGPHAGRAQPLVYLSREHVHQALLQGTVQVELPDGDVRTFAVHKNNGRSFRRGVSAERQERMWYFRETETDRSGGANSGSQLRRGGRRQQPGPGWPVRTRVRRRRAAPGRDGRHRRRVPAQPVPDGPVQRHPRELGCAECGYRRRPA